MMWHSPPFTRRCIAAPGPVALFFVLLFTAHLDAAEDVIEFLSGAKLRGQVVSIDRKGKRVEFESKIGTLKRRRFYSYGRIHAVLYKGKRYVLNKKTSRRTGGGTSKSGSSDSRTAQEVNRIIQTVGSTPPDWLQNTRLNFPRTLDLSWPQAKSSQWNTRKNVGHFLWSVINENPRRWREGVKLMYHILSVHRNNARLRTRVAVALGEQYHNLFQDYARAAYWFRQGGVDRKPPKYDPDAPVHMAECYWRLGNKQMATALLNKVPRVSSIKLVADMGNISGAMRIANAYLRSRNSYTVANACLYAGDACRTNGRYKEALRYYRRAVNLRGGNVKRLQRFQNRARASITAIQLFEQSDVMRVADGVYRSQSLGYEGPVQVEVVVKNRRIERVRVVRHREKQFYSALKDTPRKIIAKQGVKGVDTTSSATITSEAIINATAKALAGK